MESVKVLYVSQEITPYLPETQMSLISRHLPQGAQEKGREIRTFMPRFGCINERRNQLHEVIRLSGMNLIIDDSDHPLIIKVASIQAARMQVYFIDNEDYFQRKSLLTDDDGNFFEDNDERAIFFARGVMETVKKLRWSPDIIHCHGWFTSFLPIYLKKHYSDDPLFSESKVVLSLYDEKYSHQFNKDINNRIVVDGIKDKDLSTIKIPNAQNVAKLGMDYSDGIIFGSNDVDDELKNYASERNIPVLQTESLDNYIDAYSEFYDEILTVKIDDSK